MNNHWNSRTRPENGKIKNAVYLFCILLLWMPGCRPGNGPGNNDFSIRTETDPTLRLSFRPNIVWLIAEDVGYTIPPFGDSTVSTPNLDSMAGQGIRYTGVFSTSGATSPNLCALFTGMYPTGIGANNAPVFPNGSRPSARSHHYEVVLPEEVKMISEILRENGYFCTFNGRENLPFNSPVTAWNKTGMAAHWQGRDPGQPFFAVFDFEVTAKEHISDPFETADLRYEDPDFPGINEKKYSWTKRVNTDEWYLNISPGSDVPVPPYLPESGPVRDDLIRMYSNIIEMDNQAGDILRQLKNEGLLDSTLVFWFSGNGGPLPRQGGTVYDAGIHIPLIIRFPRKPEGGKYDDRLISFVDFAPTVFSLAGIPLPDYFQGMPFLGKSGKGTSRDYIYAGTDRIGDQSDMIRTARNKRYQYINNIYPERPYFRPGKYSGDLATMQELIRLNKSGELNHDQEEWFADHKPVEEFYDTRNDPCELHNLIHDSALTEEITDLRAACSNWMNSTGDMGMTPENELIQLFWPGGKQPKTGAVNYEISGQEVKLSCATPGASIGYQVIPADSVPGNSWMPYKKPIKIKPEIRIVAFARRIGYLSGDTMMIEFR